MPRKWQPRERKLVTEYVKSRFPDENVIYQAKLGGVPSSAYKSLPPDVNARILRVYERKVDALILKRDSTIMIEGKIKPMPAGVSELMLYRDLFYKEDRFKDRVDYPLRLILVMAMDDPALTRLAQNNGIKVDIFCPNWVKNYLREIRQYKE